MKKRTRNCENSKIYHGEYKWGTKYEDKWIKLRVPDWRLATRVNIYFLIKHFTVVRY